MNMSPHVRCAPSVLALLFAVLLFHTEPAAQNLLSPNGWSTWNPSVISGLQITASTIRFDPFSAVPTTCGIEQTVQVPQDGRYQLRFSGFGGSTGAFHASWTLDGQPIASFDGYDRRSTWKLQLSAGSYLLRFTTGTSNLPEDFWLMKQPELVPISGPTCEVDVVGDQVLGPIPSYFVQAPAHYVLLGLQRASSPIALPGILGHLQLDPNSEVLVLGSSPTGQTTVSVDPFVLASLGSLPLHHLQALDTGAVPEFGTGHQIEALRL